MKKKIMAYLNLICPFCNIGRKYPDSAIGKKVKKHWEEGCPCREAYIEVFQGTKKLKQVKSFTNNTIFDEINITRCYQGI